MTLEYNGKVITENHILGSILMAIGIMVFSLITVGFMALFGETVAYLLPRWFEANLFLPVFVEMWAGGVITLLFFLMIFGAKGNSFGLNIPTLEIPEKRVRSEKEIRDMIADLEEAYPPDMSAGYNPVSNYNLGMLAGLKLAVDVP